MMKVVCSLVAPSALLLLALVLLAGAAPPRTIEPPSAPRSSAPSQMSQSGVRMDASKICHNSTPCGWVVYSKLNREPQLFVQNTCECSADRRCMRAEDDLSAHAFVYRCTLRSDIPSPTNATPPSPPTDRRR